MVDDAPEPMKFGDADDAPVLALFARVQAPGPSPGLEARVLGAVAAPPPADPLARLFFAHGDEAWTFLLAATGEPDVAREALEDCLFRVHRRLAHRRHAGEELGGEELDGGPGQALVLGCARESAADAWDVLKKSGRQPVAVVDVPTQPCPRAAELLARVLDRAEKERAHLAGVQTLSVKIALACTYCHAALPRGEAVYCASCLAPHHDECFREHGRCTAPGCGEELVVRAGAPTPYQRPRRRRPLIIGLGLAAALSSAALVGQVALRGPLASGPTPEEELRAARDEALARAAKVEAEAREKLARIERDRKAIEAKRDEELARLEEEAMAKEEKLALALREAEAVARASQNHARDVKDKQREIDELRMEKNDLQDQNIELARRFDSEKRRLQQEAEAIRKTAAQMDLQGDTRWALLVELAGDRSLVDPARAEVSGEPDLGDLWGEVETKARERDLPRVTVVIAGARQRLERVRPTLSPSALATWTRRLEGLEAVLGEVERRDLLTRGLADLQALETATQRQAWEMAEACAARLEERLAQVARSKSDEARSAGKDLARLVGPAARGMRAEKALADVAARVGRIERRPDGVAVVLVGTSQLAATDVVPGTKPEVIVVSVDADQGQALFATDNRKRLVEVARR